VFQRASVCT